MIICVYNTFELIDHSDSILVVVMSKGINNRGLNKESQFIWCWTVKKVGMLFVFMISSSCLQSFGNWLVLTIVKYDQLTRHLTCHKRIWFKQKNSYGKNAILNIMQKTCQNEIFLAQHGNFYIVRSNTKKPHGRQRLHDNRTYF